MITSGAGGTPARPKICILSTTDTTPAADALGEEIGRHGEIVTPPAPDASLPRDVAAVVAFGRGDRAVELAMGNGNVTALALIDTGLSERSVELIARATDLAILTSVDPSRRGDLASAVEGHLASTHEDSEIIVEPRRQGSRHESTQPVATWVVARLRAAGRRRRTTIETADGWHLVADITLPDRSDPAPAVVLFHSGRSDRAVFGRLARLLARRGFVVCSPDWRGRGESTNRGFFVDFEGADATSPSRDVAAAYDHLDAIDEVDGRFGVLGIAHGAGFALTGALADARTRAVVFMTGLHDPSDAERARMRSGDVEFLFVSATPHEMTTRAMRDLFGHAGGHRSYFREYPEGVLGYQLFDLHPDLEPTIVEWFAEVLGP